MYIGLVKLYFRYLSLPCDRAAKQVNPLVYNMGLRELKKLRLAEHVGGARFRTKRPSKGPSGIHNSRSGKLGLEGQSHAKPAAW